ncbi:thiolase C-terminal domain-containing protein [Pseudonocardia pini]|uniref:thiolase C-terminal domain-containing protein n=1 Tax=Pseudonocardia pini TaxID=2758030 RepID=UPI0015F0E4F5|nr:transporter [Pseudonocardia pini]
MSRFRDSLAIVGIGISPTTRTGGGGLSAHMMEAQALKLAIEDAGLQPSDIHASLYAGAQQGADSGARMAGLKPRWWLPFGRMANAHNSLLYAAGAIASGNCDHVAVSLGISWLTDAQNMAKAAAEGRSVVVDKKFSIARDGGGVVQQGWTATPGAAAVHAFLASRHMHEFGTTEEQLGSVALAHRAWANLNPEAKFYDRELTMEDYLASRWVVHPYRLFDNCVVSDVACAFIVTTAERAKDLRRPPVYVKGVGMGDAGRESWWDKSTFSRTDAAFARDRAFESAGIGIEDVDLAEIYDCFTGDVIMTVEDYGFCKKGEGGPFLESGATRPGGSIPMNTHGGLLSAFHCGDMGNMIEAVRQLRGDCGDRQVPGAEIALVDGHGAELILPYMCPITGCTILGNQEG